MTTFRNKIASIGLILTLIGNIPAYVYAKPPAGVNTSAVNRYADVAHQAYERQDFATAATNYEKAYNLSKEKVFKDNYLAAYTSYAYELANDKKYEESLKICQKVLSINPQDENIKDFMAEVYYMKGSDAFYAGNIAQAKSEFQKAMKFTVSKDQTDKIKDGMSKADEALKYQGETSPSYSAAEKPQVSTSQPKQTMNSSTLADTISEMEQSTYGYADKTSPLKNRISKLEKELLGKTYEKETIAKRTDRLKRTLTADNSASPQQLAQQNERQDMTYAAPDNANNYIQSIIDQSAGRVNIFGEMPIKIYISEPPSHTATYEKALKDAFSEWEQASESKVKFEYVSNPAVSDLQVVWQDNVEDFAWQPVLYKEDISAAKKKQMYKKASTALQIGSYAAMIAAGMIGIPVLGGVGMMGNSIGSPLLDYQGSKTDKFTPDIKIGTGDADKIPEQQGYLKIKQIALHEIGHAIGIYGHSNNPNDIMYDSFSVSAISTRDANTIKEIYKPRAVNLNE